MYNDFKKANAKLRKTRSYRHKPCAVVSPQILASDKHWPKNEATLASRLSPSSRCSRSKSTSDRPLDYVDLDETVDLQNPRTYYNNVLQTPLPHASRGIMRLMDIKFIPGVLSGRDVQPLEDSTEPISDSSSQESRGEKLTPTSELLTLLKNKEKLETFVKMVAPRVFKDEQFTDFRNSLNRKLRYNHTQHASHQRNQNSAVNEQGTCPETPKSSQPVANARPHEPVLAPAEAPGGQETRSCETDPFSLTEVLNAGLNGSHKNLPQSRDSIERQNKHLRNSHEQDLLPSSAPDAWTCINDVDPASIICTTCVRPNLWLPESKLITSREGSNAADEFETAHMNRLNGAEPLPEDLAQLDTFSFDDIRALDLSKRYPSFEEEFEPDDLYTLRGKTAEYETKRQLNTDTDSVDLCTGNQKSSLEVNIDDMPLTYTLPLSKTSAGRFVASKPLEVGSGENTYTDEMQSMLDFYPTLWNDDTDTKKTGCHGGFDAPRWKRSSTSLSQQDRRMRITYKTEPSPVSTSTSSTFVITSTLGAVSGSSPLRAKQQEPLDFNLNAVNTKCATLDKPASGKMTFDTSATTGTSTPAKKPSTNCSKSQGTNECQRCKVEGVHQEDERTGEVVEAKRKTSVLEASSHLAAAICQEWLPQDTTKACILATSVTLLVVTTGTGLALVTDGVITTWMIPLVNTLVVLGSLIVMLLVSQARQNSNQPIDVASSKRNSLTHATPGSFIPEMVGETEEKNKNTFPMPKSENMEGPRSWCDTLSTQGHLRIKEPGRHCRSSSDTQEHCHHNHLRSISLGPETGFDFGMYTYPKTLNILDETSLFNGFGNINNSLNTQIERTVNQEVSEPWDNQDDNGTPILLNTQRARDSCTTALDQQFSKETCAILESGFESQETISEDNVHRENDCGGLVLRGDPSGETLLPSYDCSDIQIENIAFPSLTHTLTQASTMTKGLQHDTVGLVSSKETSFTQTEVLQKICESSATQTDSFCGNNQEVEGERDRVVEVVSLEDAQLVKADVSVQADLDARKVYMHMEKLQMKHKLALRRMQRKFLAIRRRCQKEAHSLKQSDHKKNEFLSKLQLSLPGLQNEKRSLLAERASIEKQFEEEKRKNRELVGRLTRLNQQFSKLGQQQQPSTPGQWRQHTQTQQTASQTPVQSSEGPTTTPTPFREDANGTKATRHIQPQHSRRTTAVAMNQPLGFFQQSNLKVSQQSTLLQNQARSKENPSLVGQSGGHQTPQQKKKQYGQDQMMQKPQHQEQQQVQQQKVNQQQQLLLIQQQKILQQHQQRLPIFQLFNSPLPSSFPQGHPGEAQQQQQQQPKRQQPQQQQIMNQYHH